MWLLFSLWAVALPVPSLFFPRMKSLKQMPHALLQFTLLWKLWQDWISGCAFLPTCLSLKSSAFWGLALGIYVLSHGSPGASWRGEMEDNPVRAGDWIAEPYLESSHFVLPASALMMKDQDNEMLGPIVHSPLSKQVEDIHSWMNTWYSLMNYVTFHIDLWSDSFHALHC